MHGSRREARCRLVEADEDSLELEALDGDLAGFEPGDEVRVFFYLKNNYHTFTHEGAERRTPEETVRAQARGCVQEPAAQVRAGAPRGRHRGLLRPEGAARSSSTSPGRALQSRGTARPPLGFDPSKIQGLVAEFRKKVDTPCSRHKITMLRDRLPRTWEEKVVVRLGKCLWIPAVAEDFPTRDPFPDERVITKAELVALRGGERHAALGDPEPARQHPLRKVQSRTSPPSCSARSSTTSTSVGYVHLVNEGERRDRLLREMVDYTLAVRPGALLLPRHQRVLPRRERGRAPLRGADHRHERLGAAVRAPQPGPRAASCSCTPTST